MMGDGPIVSDLDLIEVDGGTLRDFLRNLVLQAAGDVGDCRMDYLEIQMDKDVIDELAQLTDQAPIDWHPEPCRHPDTKWVVYQHLALGNFGKPNEVPDDD